MVEAKTIIKGFKKTDMGVMPIDWDVKKLIDIRESIIGLTYCLFNVLNSELDKYHKIMNEWYCAHLKTQTATIVTKWEKTLNIKLKQFQIRQMKTQWG